MRTLVLGDVHGGYRALLQVLERSNFNFKKDKLICLGDVADGWTEVAECFELLMDVKNLVYIKGNHDQWLKNWLKRGKRPDVWRLQGGANTMKSYMKHPELKEKHLKFLTKTPFYYIDEQNRVFVHGGVSQRGIHPSECDKEFLSWDRDLWLNKEKVFIKEFKEVYVGHTSIYKYSVLPPTYGNVTFMDTGAGFEGVLSIMNIDTKEVWQSDLVADLYPENSGRNLRVSQRDKDYFINLFKDL